MELRQLQHFLAVVETGSFQGAAELMNLTPQAISRSIQRLEEEFTGRLLERKQGDRRRISPTVFGKLLLPRAQEIVAQAQLFRSEMDNYMGLGKEMIRLGVGTAVARSLMPAILEQFLAEYPEARFQIIKADTATILKQLTEGMYHLAICDEPEEPLITPEFSVEPLFEDYAVFAVKGNHPLAMRRALTLAELEPYPWLIVGPYRRVGFELNALAASAGMKEKTRSIDTTSIELAIDMLSSGNYITYIPIRQIQRELDRGTLVKLPVAGASQTRWTSQIIQRKNSPVSDGQGSFLKLVRQHAAALSKS